MADTAGLNASTDSSFGDRFFIGPLSVQFIEDPGPTTHASKVTQLAFRARRPVITTDRAEASRGPAGVPAARSLAAETPPLTAVTPIAADQAGNFGLPAS